MNTRVEKATQRSASDAKFDIEIDELCDDDESTSSSSSTSNNDIGENDDDEEDDEEDNDDDEDDDDDDDDIDEDGDERMSINDDSHCSETTTITNSVANRAKKATSSSSINNNNSNINSNNNNTNNNNSNNHSNKSNNHSRQSKQQLNGSCQTDIIQAKLAAAGPTGVAAAAAIASARKRKRPLAFETNPSIRKRQQTRLIRKLRASIDEYSMRVGQQAVVLIAMPGKTHNNFKVFGAQPLENVIRACRHDIMSELESSLLEQAPEQVKCDASKHELPPLVIDGIPTPVEKMTQAQLRAFIPMMLKYSTGRGKPGWGKDSTRPPWWPETLPWANVRSDARGDSDKHKISWTTTLRQIVVNCYKFHGRDDLLPTFKDNEDATREQDEGGRKFLSMRTIASVNSSNSNNCNNNSNSNYFKISNASSSRLDKAARNAAARNNINANNHDCLIDEQQLQQQQQQQLFEATNYANFVHTINNADGTVSLIQVDPTNAQILTLPDGTQVRAVRLQAVDADALCMQAVGGELTTHGSANQTLELSDGQASIALQEGALTVDGQIILTGDDGTQSAYSMSNLVSIPASMYEQFAQSGSGQQVTLVAADGSEVAASIQQASSDSIECSNDKDPKVAIIEQQQAIATVDEDASLVIQESSKVANLDLNNNHYNNDKLTNNSNSNSNDKQQQKKD